jgi:hypothetical protein
MSKSKEDLHEVIVILKKWPSDSVSDSVTLLSVVIQKRNSLRTTLLYIH